MNRKKLLTALCILLPPLLYLLFFHPFGLDNAGIKNRVLAGLETIEESLLEHVASLRKRAARLFADYETGDLKHHRLKGGEALVMTRYHQVDEYFGEIFYFKQEEIDIGRWCFIEKRDSLYFLEKMAEDVFYVRFFCNQEDNFILDQVKHNASVKEIIFYKGRPGPTLPQDGKNDNTYHYDQDQDVFFYTHLLNGSTNGLVLYLKFSKCDVERYYKERGSLFLFIYMALLLLWGTLYYYRKKRIVAASISWFSLLTTLLIFTATTGAENLYLPVGKWFTFHSLYEILILLIALVSFLYLIRDRLKRQIVCIVMFNLTLPAALYVSHLLFTTVTFNYLLFDFNYVVLAIINFLLLLVPIFLIRNIRPDKNKFAILGFLLLQTAVTLIGGYVLKLDILSLGLVSLVAFALLFSDRKFLTRVSLVFLLAISIYHLTSDHALTEKKEFISGSLKKIFLNQNNYAKFIAREIVYQLNRESDNFHEFFQENAASRLKYLWQNTIASRENIASGIFVQSPDGQVLAHYSYQMQFLKVNISTFFPFWAIEDATASFYGKDTSLAVASIEVIRGGEHLGRIFVQVLNSPELILRHQDKVNIFTIDNKINGRDLSYIKLNENQRIVENPSNINLKNVSGILEFNDQWIDFRFIDLTFKGYIFKHNMDTIVIFFPAETVFKHLSEIIKIFILLMAVFLLLYFKEVKKIEWKSIYYSFSIRVFSFLILISLLTAIIFSIFSLNFNSRSSMRQSRKVIYERGHTAQNIGYSLLEEGGEFTRDHLQLFSRILNSDICVYREGVLIDTSNYKKLSRVPDYLDSNIPLLLNERNQKFILLEKDGRFHLYFKIYDYILDVEFSYNWGKIFSKKGYYTNFIITLFFMLTIIGFSSAFFFRNKIISPIHGLNKGMAEVKKGNLSRLTKFPSELEIKNLYTGFNAMIEGIREQRRNISELSRMRTIIKLGRRVAHEVKNPLTPIKLSAEQIVLALNDKNPNYEDIIKQSVNYIIDETDHLKKVSHGFLDLSRLDELYPKPFNLLELVHEEVFNYCQLYSHIDFASKSESDKVEVVLDKVKLKQVLKNLINNSIDAIGDKQGRIGISVDRRDGHVYMEVSDNGVGIDEGGLAQMYDADYSTKDVGTGLGLFIVKRIIELHNGHIHIESVKGEGTRVIMDFPEEL
ncbi:MAG: GHKL domain-containing protein [bacterium]|nr:GHKL domain-containing protein [bacterium]